MVLNSDFEGGNTEFTSGYNYQMNGLLGANRYSIRHQTNLVNTQWNAIDHTTGTPTGNFLALDGPLGNIAYSTTVNMMPNTDYVFCM